MPPPQQNPRVAVGLILLLLIGLFFFPDGNISVFSAAELAIQRLQRHREAIDLLNSSRWGDFSPRQSNDPAGTAPTYLNLTGFRAGDGFAWDDLARFKEHCLEWSRSAIPPVGGQDLWELGQGEAVWQNASGVVKGTWIRRDASVTRQWTTYNLSDITPNLTWAGAHSEWARNITGREGKILFDIDDSGRHMRDIVYDVLPGDFAKTGGEVRSAQGSVRVEDVTGSGITWDLRMHGVQWPRQGAILLTTTSEKFDGIFGLPHLTPSPDFFQSSQRLLNLTLSEVLRKKEKEIFNDGVMPWTSDVANPPDILNPSPHCEYVLYAQVHPPDREHLNMRDFDPQTESMAAIIHDIEEELRFPNGAPIRGIPELQLSVIIWSPDCSFFLETKGPPTFPAADGRHLVGMKTEVIFHEVKIWVLAFAGVIMAQTFLLMHQMRESSTPSTMGRISYSTMSAMVIADGGVFVMASMFALTAGITYLSALTLLVAAFLSMAIGGQFLSDIHKVQEPPNRRRAERDQPSRNGTPQPPSTPPNGTSTGAQPRPAADGPPRRDTRSPPIIIPSDQDIDAEIFEATNAAAAVPRAGTRPAQEEPEVTFQSVVVRYSLAVCFILLVSIASTSWYPRVRAIFLNSLAFIYLSLWLPQIHRNTLRNCRRAMTWPFMIGQSALRLLPFAYFYLKEDNILFSEPDRRAFLAFCAWLWIQLWILAFQDVLGPRFGIPKSWTPDAWDYHPVLREDSVEAGGLPIGLLSEPGSPSLERVRTGDDKEKRKSNLRSIDCAICREVLEVPILKAGEEEPKVGSVVGVFTRRNYMVTPCRHIFHSACLEGWMRFRLQCPICREELPPL